MVAAAAAHPTSLILRSKITPNFTITVGPRVIQSCTILKNVTEHTDNSSTIDVEMSQKQLEKFVELHERFEFPSAPKDHEFTAAIFDAFSDEEFKDFTFKADFLDSQRFLEAAGDYILDKIANEDDIEKLTEYLELENDWTPDERRAIKERPLEFFTSIKFDDEKEKEENADDEEIIDPNMFEQEN